MHDSANPRKASSPNISAARHARLAFAAMIVANICLAFGPWMVRLADVGPLASGFWRLAIGAPLLLLLAPVAGQPIGRISRGLWVTLAVGGLFFAADLGAWHSGIVQTKLANAALFGNITSFTFALYGFLVARAWPGRNQAAALLLAAFGVVLLLGRSYELSPRNFAGDLLCLLAGLFYTGYLVAIERARGSMKPLPTLAIATLAGILPLLGLALLLGQPVWPENWTPLIILAIGSQVIGQGLTVYAIGHLPPVVIGLGLLSQPVIGSMIGWFVYGEGLSTGDWIGAIAIGIALVLVRRPDRAR
jgi:drug/metabolite transporter (DMT)-like permease